MRAVAELMMLTKRAYDGRFTHCSLYVEPGQLVKLTDDGLFMRLRADRHSESDQLELVAELLSEHWAIDQAIPLEPMADLRVLCGLTIVPLMICTDDAGRLTRVRLRFEQVPIEVPQQN